MTTEQNIFSAQDQVQQSDAVGTTTAAPETKPAFSIPVEVNALVGDGKKYRSVEDALKSIPNAQTHIQRLEEENKQFREELAKRRAAEDLLNEIKQASVQQPQTHGSVEADPEVLSQIVEQVLEKKTAQQTAQQNAKSVVDKFTAVYGDKAEDMYIQLAKQSGMSIQSLNNLASQSPSAVLKLAGIDSKSVQTGGKIQSDNISYQSTNNNQFATKVPQFATTQQVIDAMEASRQKVLSQYKG